MIKEEQFLPNGATIAIWEITETVDELLELLNLDPFVIEQISMFSSEKRKLEYLAVRCALKHVTKKQISISYLPSGMPYINDHSMQISISHTGRYAVIMIHPTTPVGIDIEKISDKVVRIKNKFLSIEELQNIDSRSEKIHLVILWAAKEALYKIIGVEHIDFTKDLKIEPFQPYMKGNFTAREFVSEVKATYTLEYQVYPEYVIVHVIK